MGFVEDLSKMISTAVGGLRKSLGIPEQKQETEPIKEEVQSYGIEEIQYFKDKKFIPSKEEDYSEQVRKSHERLKEDIPRPSRIELGIEDTTPPQDEYRVLNERDIERLARERGFVKLDDADIKEKIREKTTPSYKREQKGKTKTRRVALPIRDVGWSKEDIELPIEDIEWDSMKESEMSDEEIEARAMEYADRPLSKEEFDALDYHYHSIYLAKTYIRKKDKTKVYDWKIQETQDRQSIPYPDISSLMDALTYEAQFDNTHEGYDVKVDIHYKIYQRDTSTGEEREVSGGVIDGETKQTQRL